MDYIQYKIDRKIEENEMFNNSQELKLHQKVKLEYYFYLILGYLWSKNFDEQPESLKRETLKMLSSKLTLGSVLKLIEKLDRNKLYKDLLTQLWQYNSLRIDADGHGYTYKDGVSNYIDDVKEIFVKIRSTNAPLINEEINLITIIDNQKGTFRGFMYSDGGEKTIWSCPDRQNTFNIGHTYGSVLRSNSLLPEYFDLTPFIHMVDEDEFHIFQSVAHKLSGTVKYNRINKTGQLNKDWSIFSELFQKWSDGNKKFRVTQNKTIINEFTPNYEGHSYIDVGDNRDRIRDFLVGSMSYSSVCANLWGHGGVGKTATTQKTILELADNEKTKEFNCIIFLSNKDRFYNIYKDSNELISIGDRTSTFEGLIIGINQVLTESDKAEFNVDRIINYDSGRILMVIDDFETFEKEDKHKINNFIKSLKPQYHKVIITTRATIRIGDDDIIFNELDENETVEFLMQVNLEKYPNRNLDDFRNELNSKKIELRQITQGKPLRIWQFANAYDQVQNLDKILVHFQTTKSSALSDFFYGRYYLYLGNDAKDVFDVMGQLDYGDELIASYSKVKYGLKWAEDNEDRFFSAISELKRLRIVEEVDSERFKIWDKDILNGMKTTFRERDDSVFKGTVNKRVKQVNKININDADEALLSAAQENKNLGKSVEEIKEGFRQIINRDSASISIKFRALNDLTNYYRINLAMHELAFNELKGNEGTFGNMLEFIRLFSLVCVEVGKFADSVELLSKFQMSSNFNKLPEEDKAEVFGLLITRKKGQILSEKSRGIDKDKNILDRKISEVINKYGKPLFKGVKTLTFKVKGQKTNVETGLRHLVEFCIQTGDIDLATEICDYADINFDQHFRKQFQDLRSKFPQMEKFSLKSTNVHLIEKISPITHPILLLEGKEELEKNTDPVDDIEYMGRVKYIWFNKGGAVIQCGLDQDVSFSKERLVDCDMSSLIVGTEIIVKLSFNESVPFQDAHGNYRASSVYLPKG